MGALAFLLVAATAPAPAHTFPDTLADEWTQSEACWRQVARAYADYQAPNASDPPAAAADAADLDPAASADPDAPARLWLSRAAALGDWDSAPPHPPTDASLSRALLALYATQDVEPSYETLGDLQAFSDQLDPALRERLAPLVSRLAHALEHHRAAYAGPAVDQAQLVHAADELLFSASEQAPALEALPSEAWPEEPVRDPVGVVAVGSTGNDTYSHNRILQVDPGGSDEYHNNAGGAWVPSPSLIIPDINDLRIQEVALHLDLAGDDFYGEMKDNFLDIILQEDQSSHAAVAAQGGAQDAVGVMVEWQGNDTYVGGDRVQGGTFGSGVGVAWDRHGNDSWEANGPAQGGSTGGIGLLVDEQGDDSHVVSGRGLGYARGASVGILSDSSGDDSYDGASHNLGGYGTRGTIDGRVPGHGLLIDDGEGDDAYLWDNNTWAENNATWAHQNVGVGCDDG